MQHQSVLWIDWGKKISLIEIIFYNMKLINLDCKRWFIINENKKSG